MNLNPFTVAIYRGTHQESVHKVCAVITTQNKNLQKITSYGDSNNSVFPRSCLKPIQALPMFSTGAFQAFNTSQSELALACASHRGEDTHIEVVKKWLTRIGLDESDLECGTHPPSHPESLYQLYYNHEKPCALHNNCSGKHTGMLMTAIHCKESLKGYTRFDHPIQQRIIKFIESYSGFKFKLQDFGIDGCSIPAPILPLQNISQAFSQFAIFDNPKFSDIENEWRKIIFNAFVNNPLLTSGTLSYCTDIMKLATTPILVKGGAEGIMIAAIPDSKTGIAIKTIDGNSRATEVVMSHLLMQMGYLPSGGNNFLEPILKNWSEIETGTIKLII